MYTFCLLFSYLIKVVALFYFICCYQHVLVNKDIHNSCVCVRVVSMMGQQTVSPAADGRLHNHSDPSSLPDGGGGGGHQHLSAADIVAMLHGLSADQQHEFYQAIGLEHEQQFYSMLGLCPTTNHSLLSQPVCPSVRPFHCPYFEYVCLPLRLSFRSHISETTRLNFASFLRTLFVTVARFFSDGDVIHYKLPVWGMMSRFQTVSAVVHRVHS